MTAAFAFAREPASVVLLGRCTATKAKQTLQPKRYFKDMNPRFGVRYMVLASLSALLLSAPALPSLARPHSHPVAASDQAQRFSVAGSVAAVDYDANAVTVTSGSRRVTLVITPTTVIDDRGGVGSIADIHPGRKLVASGIIEGGSMVAQSISLR